MATRTNSVPNATNFTTALGGTVASNDDILVNQYAAVYTAGTNLSTYDLLSFHITNGFNGKFENNGELTLVVDQTGTGVFKNESNSTVVQIKSTSVTGVIKTVVNAPVNDSQSLRIRSALVTTLYQKSGTLSLEEDCDCETLNCYGGVTVARKTSGATPIDTLTVYGGSVMLSRDIGTGNFEGGSVTIDDATCIPATINVRGATVKIVEGGTVTNFNGYAGVLDLSGLRAPITFSNSVFHPGMTIRRSRKNSIAYTLSSNTDVAGGARIEFVD